MPALPPASACGRAKKLYFRRNSEMQSPEEPHQNPDVDQDR
jgi:hypothetical protein